MSDYKITIVAQNVASTCLGSCFLNSVRLLTFFAALSLSSSSNNEPWQEDVAFRPAYSSASQSVVYLLQLAAEFALEQATPSLLNLFLLLQATLLSKFKSDWLASAAWHRPWLMMAPRSRPPETYFRLGPIF